MNYKRDVSMSVSDAIERIQKNTGKRQDSCARSFAHALAQLNPELTFWQNTPPDIEDLTAAQVTHVPETVRQVWPAPFTTTGRTIGSWILDVYAGSKKKVRHGNKWDEPYEFNYGAAFKDAPIPPDVNDLPQPLMKNFRADRTIMRSICTTAAISIKPWKRKTAKIATKFLDDAAQQVAGELPQGRELTRSDIEGYLRSLTDLDRNWVLPIYEVGFVPADETESELGKPYDYDLIIVRWEADRRDTKSDTNSIDKFVKRVQKFLN